MGIVQNIFTYFTGVYSDSPAHCIICHQEHLNETVEHIVPQSLGNVHYILRKGIICARCNQRFSRYENRVVSSESFMPERVNRGLISPQTRPTELQDADVLFVLLKIMYEALYQSRREVFKRLDHESILDTLYKGQKYSFPLIKNKLINKSKSIPGLMDRWRLKGIGVSLRYLINSDTLSVEWRYGKLSFITYINTK